MQKDGVSSREQKASRSTVKGRWEKAEGHVVGCSGWCRLRMFTLQVAGVLSDVSMELS